MDTTKFDAVARIFGSGMTRREALRGLVAGAAAVTAGGALLAVEDGRGRQERSARRRTRTRRSDRPHSPTRPPAPPVNVCAGKNWCIDRTQTCGPAGGYGKCLVDATGGNICAEILFQVQSCTECEAPNCTNCRCVPAAGGGDKCNNGANGYDFICVREV